jgi:hypothetical protein
MLKALVDVPVAKTVKTQTLVATGITMGLSSTLAEYALGWVYEKALKEPFFVYHPEDGLNSIRHTSYLSPVMYGTMATIGVELGRSYCNSKGYTNLNQIRPDEWLGMFITFGLGMTAAELIGGSVMRAVTGKEFYRYPTSGLKYTHIINVGLWGTAGIVGFIAAMRMINRFENAPKMMPLESAVIVNGMKKGLIA